MKECYGFPERVFWACLFRLRDQSFEPFFAYLKASLAEHREALEAASDPVIISRLQGRIAQLKEIIGTVEESTTQFR
nr:MAG TPA: hypothetical protein [Caudoviricetes sp.]